MSCALQPVAMYEMRVMAPLLDALSESLELVQGPQRQSLYIVRHINLVRPRFHYVYPCTHTHPLKHTHGHIHKTGCVPYKSRA